MYKRQAFEGNDGSEFADAAFISAYVDGTPGANDMPGRLVFSTTASGTVPTERMRISANGDVNVDSGTLYVDAVNNRVGIGITSVIHKVNVSNGTVTGLLHPDGTSNFGFGTYSNHPLVFYANDSEKIRLDTSGRLLVGTSTATGGILDVATSAGNGAFVAQFKNTNSANDGRGILNLVGNNSGDVNTLVFAGGRYFGTDNDTLAVINNAAAGGISFCVGGVANGTRNERMRIDSNGAVGIGALAGSNAKRLHVIGSGDDTTPVVNITRNTSGGGGLGSAEVALNVNAPSSQNNSTITAIKTYASSSLELTSYAIDASVGRRNNGTHRAAVFRGGQGNTGGYGFQTVVDILADVTGSGTNGGVRGLYIENPAYSGATNVGITLTNKTTASVTHTAIQFVRGTSTVGTIQTTTTGTSYNTSSDYRLKENIVSLDNASTRVNQLQVHRFNFINDPDTTVDGFLAHEVQEIVPEAVTGERDGTKTEQVVDENNQPILDGEGNPTFQTVPVYQVIDQSKLVPLLTAALQEALAKIETLEARITALETP